MIKPTPYASRRMDGRSIPPAWVEATVTAPDWTEQDPEHPARTRMFRAIPENGGRVLRVVVEGDGADLVVVTAHFDRAATKRSRRS